MNFRNILFFLFALFLFLLPLFYSRETLQGFGVPKFTLFILSIALLLFLFAISFFSTLFQKQKTPKKQKKKQKEQKKKSFFDLGIDFSFFIPSWAGVFFFLFFISFGVATFFSSSPEQSFWGAHQYHHGFFLLLLLTLFALFILLLRPQKKEILLYCLLPIFLSGIFESFLLISEYFGNSVVSVEKFQEERAVGTLGQSNAAGRFLIFSFFAGLAFLTLSPQKNRFSLQTLWNIFIISSLVFFLFALFATGSRRALLALGVGILSLGFCFQKIRWASVIALFLLFAGGAFYFTSLTEDTIRYESIRSRILIWQSMPEMIQDFPYMGIGPELFFEVYPQYMPSDLVNFENPHNIPHRPHNEILDLTIHIGILGALFFLLFLFFLVGKGISAAEKCEEKKSKNKFFFCDVSDKWIFVILISAIIASTLARNLEFGSITDLVLFSLVTAILLSMSSQKPKEKKHFSSSKFLRFLAMPIFSIFVIFSFFLFAVAENIWTADKEAKKGNYFAASEKMPFERKYLHAYADQLFFQKKYTEMEKVLEELEKYHPSLSDIFLFRGRMLFAVGKREEASIEYEKALSLAPNRIDFWEEWKQVIEKGDVDREKIKMLQEEIQRIRERK